MKKTRNIGRKIVILTIQTVDIHPLGMYLRHLCSALCLIIMRSPGHRGGHVRQHPSCVPLFVRP